MTETRKRLTKEEIQAKMEKRIAMAQQRDARVIQINSHRGNTMTNILRQFDKIYNIFKDRIGESGEKGIPLENAGPLLKRAEDVVFQFSELTEEIAGLLNLKYYAPDEISTRPSAAGSQAAK